jgi:hypothetical protein
MMGRERTIIRHSSSSRRRFWNETWNRRRMSMKVARNRRKSRDSVSNNFLKTFSTPTG